jgi:hypothetical protein
MKKFEVTFYCDEDHYEKTFEANDINSLINFLNEQLYIHIPGTLHDIKSKRWRSHTVLYMKSVTSLGIDEVLFDDDSLKKSYSFKE